jgi:hypothetical protein
MLRRATRPRRRVREDTRLCLRHFALPMGEPLPEPLAPFFPQFRYVLTDICARTGAELTGTVMTRLVLLALRHFFSAHRY